MHLDVVLIGVASAALGYALGWWRVSRMHKKELRNVRRHFMRRVLDVSAENHKLQRRLEREAA